MDISETVLTHYAQQKRVNVPPPLIACEPLPEVYVRRLDWHVDARGALIEAHRTGWGNMPADCLGCSDSEEHARQVYVSTTAAGAVKGWHLHLEQTDRFFLLSGRALLVLADLRGFNPAAGSLLTPDKLAQIMADPGLRRVYDDPDLRPPMVEIALDPRVPVRVDVPPGVLHGSRTARS